MPCSSSIKRLVHRIRLKPMKKKIVGGSACRICTSHQSRARRGNDTGAETETLGWLILPPKTCAEAPARLCGQLNVTVQATRRREVRRSSRPREHLTELEIKKL